MAGTVAKLGKLNTAWKDAKKREPSSFEDLESGVYLMALTGAKVDQFGLNNKLAIQWLYTVQEGDSVGSVQADYDQLETEDNIFWAQSKLQRLGYELPENIKELPEILEDIQNSKPTLRCKVVEKNGYVHVYVNKLVESEGGQTREELLGEPEVGGSSTTAAPETTSTKIEVGSEVSHTDGSTGVVKKVNDDGYDVDFEGEVYGCEASEITLIVVEPEPVEEAAAASGGGGEVVVGSQVTFKDEGETFTGKVMVMNDATESADIAVDGTNELWDIELTDLSVVSEEAPAKPQRKKATKKKKPADKEATIEVGSDVTYTADGTTGKVTAINGDAVDVKFEDGVYEVKMSEITLSE